jgi:DNA repair ATPase RecN
VGARDTIQVQRDRAQEEFDDLDKREETWRSAVLLIEGLAEAARTQVCDSVTALATSAMQDIFGEEAGCQLTYEEVGSRGAHKPVFRVWDQDGIAADPMRGMGGSAAQVIGLALRVFFLLKSGTSRFLFLDEPLDGVDDVNVRPVAAWIRKLCDELGMQIVMISHLGPDVFEDTASRVLRVERTGKESIVKVRGTQ